MAGDGDKGPKKPKAAGSTPTGDLKRGLRTTPSSVPPTPSQDLKRTGSQDLRRPGTQDLKKAGSTQDLKKPAGRRLELIDYGDDEPLVDHKGRSRPLYKPQSPRPHDETWRPSRPVKLLLGLFPGLRLLALQNVREGLTYVLLGIFTLIGGVMLSSRWAANVDRIQHLQLRRELLVGHAALIAGTVWVFELLRLAGALAERTRGPRLPRVLASFVVPGFLVAVGSLELVSLWPRLVEPACYSAALLAAGGLPGVLWCAFDGGSRDPEQQRWLRRAGGLIVALGAGAGLALLLSQGDTLAESAQAHGFILLPRLLRSSG